jgi:hypothetical protein
MNNKICINGKVRDMTPSEIAAMEKQANLDAIAERSRPLTESEVSRMLITQQINTLTVDDNTALRMRDFYPTFESIVGQTIEKQGFKFTYADKLWATVQPNLLIQAHYPPGIGMESLYTEVCETHAGTIDDPIPYNGNMVLESGKYYIQDNVIYLCNRDTVNPVYNPLAELVGQFVEEV